MGPLLPSFNADWPVGLLLVLTTTENRLQLLKGLESDDRLSSAVYFLPLFWMFAL